jgi:hypothetical protein
MNSLHLIFEKSRSWAEAFEAASTLAAMKKVSLLTICHLPIRSGRSGRMFGAPARP